MLLSPTLMCKVNRKISFGCQSSKIGEEKERPTLRHVLGPFDFAASFGSLSSRETQTGEGPYENSKLTRWKTCDFVVYTFSTTANPSSPPGGIPDELYRLLEFHLFV
uniref:Uncharacterized protein n=1 Tax=Onchocerca volvulus TaxID=6282 RepID=A0A8R1U0X3_ONCVO